MSDAQSSPAGPLDPALPHDSLKPNIIIACALCWWIAAFFVGLRFYTRGVIIRVLGWSDWSILLALVCLTRRRGTEGWMEWLLTTGVDIFRGHLRGGDRTYVPSMCPA